MNTKHTAGNWKTRKGFSAYTIEIFAPDPEIKKPFKPTELAVVEADTPEGKANARLIAAAPELLEALQMMLGCELMGGDQRKGLGPDKPGTSPVAKARAAIAKATGETP